MLYLVAQATNNFKNETEFLQYAIPLLISVIGILFYLLRDVYNSRIADKEVWVKTHEEMQKKLLEIQLKNFEILEGLKKSFDISNDMTERLITVLDDDKVVNLKQRIKKLESGEFGKGGIGNVLEQTTTG